MGMMECIAHRYKLKKEAEVKEMKQKDIDHKVDNKQDK